MGENQSAKPEFVREKIKQKPVNKKKIAHKLLVSALCGLIFAFTASAGILTVGMLMGRTVFGWKSIEDVRRWAQDRKPDIVVVDTEEASESKETSQTQEPSEIEESSELKEPESEMETETPVEPSMQPQIDPEEFWTLENYQKLQTKLYEIGERASWSLASITTIVEGDEWSSQLDPASKKGMGIIFEYKDGKCYILTVQSEIVNASGIHVSFRDGSYQEAELHASDPNTGLAILTVDALENLEEFQKSMPAVSFGRLYGTKVGAQVLALGNSYSICAGAVASVKKEVMLSDLSLPLICTNISRGENTDGFLINTKGELIGVVLSEYCNSQQNYQVVPMVEIQRIVDKLMEKKEIPYLGLHVSTVTDRMSEEYSLPKGLYITDMDVDSPSMNVGMQSGDIVVRVNNIPVETSQRYIDLLFNQEIQADCRITIRRPKSEGFAEITYKVPVGSTKNKKD